MLGLGLGTSKGGFVDALAEVTNTKSIIFDGGDEYVDCGNAIVTSYPFTVAGWLKPTLNNGLQVLTLSDVSASNVYYSIAWNSSNVFQLQARNTSVKKISSQTYGSLSGWYHIAGVFTSATDRTLYVNGVKDHSGEENLDSVTFNSNIDTTTLGALNRPTPAYGTGNLDEIAIWNDSLTANEVLQIYNSNRATLDLSTDTGSYSSSANLKAWWRMGDEASTRVLDTNANNLVIPDIRKTFFSGKSIDFDGSDDYIEVSDSNNLSFGDSSSDSAFSISAWIYMDDATDFQILNKGVFNTDGEYNFRTNSSDKLVFALYDESVTDTHESVVSSALTSYEGQWIHVVGTYDGTGGTSANSGLELYINGSNATDTRSGLGTYVAMENLAGNVRIGRLDTNYGNGKICDVAVWNTELDANTIASIYNSGEPNNLLLSASYTTGSGVDKTANLQAYYRMGNGTLDLDSSSGSSNSALLIADQTNATLGSELITDPTFSLTGTQSANTTGTYWETGADWSIGSGVATHDGSGTSNLKALAIIDDDGIYKISLTVGGTSTPIVKCQIGSTSENSGNLGAGTHTFILKSSNAHDDFIIRHVGGAPTIDDVSCKKIQGNAGVMENMSAFDVVDHAPNRNSGDMINFDATADIETDTPTQIYTVANTKSVLFDGTDDFINIGDFTTSGTLTVSAWFKVGSTSLQRTLLNFASSSNTDGIMINSYNGRSDLDIAIKYNAGSDSDFNFRTTNTFNDSSWHHIVVVKSSGTLDAVYINGQLETRATPTLFVSLTAENAIGNNKNSENQHEWNGNIDEVAVWNTALSASQVAQIYHGSKANFDLSQNGGGYTSASNLQAWWRMGDGTIDDNNIAGNGLIGDQTDTTLGSELIIANPYVQNYWDAQGTNTISYVSGQSATVSYGDNQAGFKIYFDTTNRTESDGYDGDGMTTETLEVGKNYKLSITLETNDSDVYPLMQNTDQGNILQVAQGAGTNNYIFYFTYKSTSSLLLRLNNLSSGETVKVSNISLKKINGNSGIMINMPNNAIETDTP